MQKLLQATQLLTLIVIMICAIWHTSTHSEQSNQVSADLGNLRSEQLQALQTLQFMILDGIEKARMDIIDANARFAIESADLCATERMRQWK